MAFNSEQKTISNRLLTEVVYNIPRNQREYVWQEKNWSELWNDITFAKGDVNKAHFIGSVVLMDRDEKDGVQYYDIIDGQQRIITLVLFVAAIMQSYKKLKEDSSYKGLTRFLISSDTQDNKICKIQSEYQPSIESIIDNVLQINKSYDDIISELSIAKDKLIINCFTFFYDKLKDLELNELKEIQSSLFRTNYINITATTEEDSYTIFEILNARGMILEDSELLKNYFMRYTRPITEIDRLKNSWKQDIESPLEDNLNKFFIHYVRHKFKTSDGKVSAYEIIKENNSANTVKEQFEDIKKKVKFYKRIIQPVKCTDGGECSSLEYTVFKLLKVYRGELFRPLILSIMNAKEAGKIDEKKYNTVLSFIQRYFTCYNLISGETSNKISPIILKFAIKIENDFKLESLKELVEQLNEKLPLKETFTKSFSVLGWSHSNPAYADSSKKRKVQVALAALENLSAGDVIDDFTVEHILPDSEKKEHSLIGNLLPLESSLNEKCKDKSLSEKLEYYKKSKYIIVRSFADRYSSNQQFDPEKRASYMASKIYDALKTITI